MALQKILNFSVGLKLDRKYWASLILIFSLTFLIYSPFINLCAVAMTDLGFQLTNQDLAYQMGFKYVRVCPSWWLTDVLAGWWMHFTENYGLKGVNVGGILVTALTSTIFCEHLISNI